jgi:hypothetical protein
MPKEKNMRSTKRLLLLITLLALFTLSPARAGATEIWGRITGLQEEQSTINYIANVRIRDERGDWYQGRAAWDGFRGGLIWTAIVPNVTRSYQVWVWTTLDSATVWWNPETAYGSWARWQRRSQCHDIRFWLK